MPVWRGGSPREASHRLDQLGELEWSELVMAEETLRRLIEATPTEATEA